MFRVKYNRINYTHRQHVTSPTPVEGADEDRVNPHPVIIHAAVADLCSVGELDGEGKLNIEKPT